MRTQQEAARAEQQRIKALVLNYDLRAAEGEVEDRDGEDSYILQPNPNTDPGNALRATHYIHSSSRPPSWQRRPKPLANTTETTGFTPLERSAQPHHHGQGGGQGQGGQRGSGRRAQQSRKLQMSDLDW